MSVDREGLREKISRVLERTDIGEYKHVSGNLEGFGEGASEDDVMGGDLIYPTQIYPQYPTANSMQPCLLPSTTIPSTILTTPPWPWLLTLPLPHGRWFLSLHPPHLPPHRPPHRPQPLPLQTRKVLDSKATKDRTSKKRRRAALAPTSLALLSRARSSCTSIVTSMVG
jgi:hypothetical protein